MQKKPDLQYILDLKSNLSTYYSEMHRRFDDCEKAYELDMSIPVPRGFDKYIPPTGRSLVDTMVDHHITNNPVITVPRARDTAKEQGLSDKMEKFFHTVLKWNTRRWPTPPIRENAKQNGIMGMFVIKGPLIDKNYLMANNGQWVRNFPFLIKPVYPRNIYPTPKFLWTGEGEVIESYKRTAAEVKSEWANWDMGSHKDMDEVDWIEYWSDEWRAYICDSDLIGSVIPNKYNFVPYEIGFSGGGRITGKPEELAVGLLWPVLSALYTEAREKTAMDAIMQVHAFPPLVSDLDPSKIIHPSLGEIGHVPKEYNVRLLYEYNIPPALFNHLASVINDVRQGTYSEVVEGRHAVGVASGYMEAIRVGQARLKFGPSIESLENKWSNALSKCAFLLEKVLDEPVTIWGQIGKHSYDENISPDEIKGHYNCYLTLESSTPEENDRRSMNGLNLYRAGAISLLHLLENYIRIPDSSGEMKRIMVERVLSQPDILSALAAAATKDWGIQELIDEVKSAQPQSPPIPQVPQEGSPFYEGQPPEQYQPGGFEEQNLIQRQYQRLGAPGQGYELGSPAEMGILQ